MKLFEIKNYVVEFAPQALLLEPFKVLWERDKSKGKTVSRGELAYVWYMEDVRSDFFDIMDPKEREKEVLMYLTPLPKGWTADKAVQEAQAFYGRYSETISMKFLKDTMIMINNLRSTMRTIDFQERDKSNKLVYDYAKAVSLANQIPSLLNTLKEIYREIEKESQEDSLMRGGRTKSMYEDGI